MTRLSENEWNAILRAKLRPKGVGDIDVITRARELQAQAVGEMIGKATRLLARVSGLAALYRALRRRLEYQRTVAALRDLDDAVLADIGVERADIRRIALGCCMEPTQARPSPSRRMLERLAVWRAQHRTTRELSRLDDRALRDIGIERSQIPEVAEAVAVNPDCVRRAVRQLSTPVTVLAEQIEAIIVRPFRFARSGQDHGAAAETTEHADEAAKAA